MLEGFAARASASSAPTFGGLALGAYSGPFGLRVTGALRTDRTASTAQSFPGYGYGGRYGCRRDDCGESYATQRGSSVRVGEWTAGADLVFEPLRTFGVGRALLLGFSPYAFGGIGYSSVLPAAGRDTGSTMLNYGLGVRHQLLGWLGVSGEARFRRALHGDSSALDLNRRNAQYRVGLTISVGGRHARPIAAAPISPAAGPCVTGACAATPLTPSASMASVGSRIVPRVLDLADGSVNVPYRAGGTSPAEGFDAAGFVQYVYGREGVELPHSVRQLAQSGMTVTPRVGNLRPGDLLFFANDGATPDHVAIYAGHDRIIHATASGGVVRYDVLGEGARGAWFTSHLVAARRVVDTTSAPERPRSDGDGAPPSDDASSGQADHAPQPTSGGSR